MMAENNYLKSFIFLCLSTASLTLYAQGTAAPIEQTTVVNEQHPASTTLPPVTWTSTGSSDEVTVENGTGANLTIVITVNDNQYVESTGSSTQSAGVDVQNCGATTHIDPGSTAICVTNDPKSPVSFSADKEVTATGTYQITQQLPKK